MLLSDRASPVVRADGLRYGFRGDAMASKNRNRNQGVSTGGDGYLTVLRRSFVRTGFGTVSGETLWRLKIGTVTRVFLRAETDI